MSQRAEPLAACCSGLPASERAEPLAACCAVRHAVLCCMLCSARCACQHSMLVPMCHVQGLHVCSSGSNSLTHAPAPCSATHRRPAVLVGMSGQLNSQGVVQYFAGVVSGAGRCSSPGAGRCPGMLRLSPASCCWQVADGLSQLLQHLQPGSHPSFHPPPAAAAGGTEAGCPQPGLALRLCAAQCRVLPAPLRIRCAGETLQFIC